MAKTNIRSIRFSDEIREAIESQAGDNFNQKFEVLVTRCLWELPAAEEQLREVNRQISEKKKELWKLTKQAKLLSGQLESIAGIIEKIVEENGM